MAAVQLSWQWQYILVIAMENDNNMFEASNECCRNKKPRQETFDKNVDTQKNMDRT